MPIKATCPECDKDYNLADTMAGKNVKCKECGNLFIVVEEPPEVIAVTTKPTNGKAKPSGLAKTVKPAVKVPTADEDDEDEEEAPAKRGKPAKGATKARKKADDDEDDEDDEDEAPSKPAKKPAKKQGGGMGMLLIGGGLAAVLLLFLCGGGIGLIIAFSGGSSKNANNTENNNKDGNGENNEQNNNANNLLTKDNFEKIKGGELPPQLLQTFGKPTQERQPPDATFLPSVSDKGTVYVWTSGANTVTVAFNPEEKATHWTATIDGQMYDKKDEQYVVGDGSSQVTKGNFDKIKGGMTDAELQALLGAPTDMNAPVNPLVRRLIGDQGVAYNWQNGADSITVNLHDGKAVIWSGKLRGRNYNPPPALQFAYKPTPTTKFTKANVDMIQPGTEWIQLHNLIGFPTNRNAQVDQRGMEMMGNKGRAESWQQGDNNLLVMYVANKVVRMVGTVEGQPVMLEDPNFAANPIPGGRLTKALYDAIVVGQRVPDAVQKTLGQPARPPVQKGNPRDRNSLRVEYVFVEGQTEITIHLNLQQVVTFKDQKNVR